MDYTNCVLKGRKYEYRIGKPLSDGTGGEGTVYSVHGARGYVAKLFHDHILSFPNYKADFLKRKLECMLRLNIKTGHRGKLRIAWPVEILYDGTRMVGYLMPRVNSSHRIYDVWRTGSQDKVFRGRYNWRKSVRVARSMAEIVAYLHENNVIIGDLNQKNFMVDRSGDVIFVDTDSYDITDPDTGKRFPCKVGLAEVLAPEMQTAGNLEYTRSRFTRESDCFSLAIQIFRLLWGGYHPFDGTIVGSRSVSASAITEQTEIVNGNCPYVRAVDGRAPKPQAAKLAFLPEDVRVLFDKTFYYDAASSVSVIPLRATAVEWKTALRRLEHARLRRCTQNYRHRFPGHNRRCPFCDGRRKSYIGKLLPVAAAAGCLIWIHSTIGFEGLTAEAAAFWERENPPQKVEQFFAGLFAPREDPKYLLPSHEKILTKSDVAHMTKEDLTVAINEIYARHGRCFQSQVLQSYFDTMDWYTPNTSVTDSEILDLLSDTELENLHFLIDYRAALTAS